MTGVQTCALPIYGLASYADRLANTTITDEQLDKLLAEMFPVDEEKDG